MKLPRAFGPYTLLRRLAVGGMAEVYVAKTHGLGGFEKHVALKLVHPHLSVDEHFVGMLVDEAKVLVKLNHANIAQVLDLGRIGDDYYISMEYVDGWNLHQIVSAARALHQQVAPEMAAHVVAETCAGLDHAHRKRDDDGRPLNLVHRDVSPQNILVSQSGEVKLVDFGIAKGAHRRGEGTEVGVIKGKYNYMSPEQAWADPMDRRSDLFSAGVVLWETLVGRMLHQEANVPKLIANVRDAAVPPLRELRPDVPEALAAIVHRATAREPSDRFPSAADMAEALRDFVYQHAPAYNARKLSADVSALMAAHAQAKADGRIADDRRPASASRRDDLPAENEQAVSVVTREEGPPGAARSQRPGPRRSSRLPPLPFDSIPPPTDRMQGPPTRMPPPPPNPRAPWPPSPRHTDPSPPPLQDWDQSDVHEPTRVDPATQGPLGSLPPDAAPRAKPLDPEFDEETTARYRPSLMAPRPDAGGGGADETRRNRSLPPPVPRDAAFPSVPTVPGAFDRPDQTARARRPSRDALRPPPSGVEAIPHMPPSPALPEVESAGRLFRGRSSRWGLLAGVGLGLLLIAVSLVGFNFFGRSPAPAGLEILSEPSGGTVFVDGVRRPEATPTQLSDFESGRDYELRVEKDGFVPWEGTYHAAPGVVQHIAVLKPEKAELYIATQPPGATLRIDGVQIGTSPLRVSALEPGRRITVQASMQGYETVSEPFTIDADQLRPRLELRLSKKPPPR